ncbi:MAG TPA: nucleotidyltransferase family protein [Chitinophagaceae bacterium]
MTKITGAIQQCAVVILAAGSSTRLGRSKQLLPYKDKTFLKHAAVEALEAVMKPVIVIIRSNSDDIKKEIEEIEVEVAENHEWHEGIASSLRCGVKQVQNNYSDVDGIIFMVCDQPYVTGILLNSLLKKQHETGLPIVASRYQNKSGTPALFHKSLFTELMKLRGDTGAGNLIRIYNDMVATVAFPKGDIDIDTTEDYEALLHTKRMKNDH